MKELTLVNLTNIPLARISMDKIDSLLAKLSKSNRHGGF